MVWLFFFLSSFVFKEVRRLTFCCVFLPFPGEDVWDYICYIYSIGGLFKVIIVGDKVVSRGSVYSNFYALS